jgi:hypothetical protein
VRRALVLAGIVAVIGAAVATINGVVDPRDEFYSGAPLTAALDSSCLLADDVVRAGSYPEFKRDLFDRRQRTAVVFDSGGVARRGLNMGFPGFGPNSLLDAMRFLDGTTPEGKRLTISVVTDVSWFDPKVRLADFDDSFASKVGYLLSPWTLASSLDLMRRSRTLAFTGWEKERVGKACVLDRGSPSPAWRADGTLVGARAAGGSAAPHAFAWKRLSPLDAALAIARTRDWRVVGLSGLTPRWETYERELKALFAKHGYRWRIRRMLP